MAEADRPTIEKREFHISAIGAQGDGVSEGYYAPFTLPGETITGHAMGERIADIEILEASSERVAPPCPFFGPCGGCALQHWAPQPYLAWKSDQIRDALARVGLEAEILPAFAAPPASRRRLALHARQVGGQTILGLKARRSWRVTPIDVCLIADGRLNAALPALQTLATAFLEHERSAPTLHLTATLTGIDVDITGVERGRRGISARTLERAADAARVADLARLTLAREILYQERPVLERLGPATVALPPGAFLQAVAAAEQAMTDFVLAWAKGARRICDLYCGVGAFTFPLAMEAATTAADLSGPAIAALKQASGATPGLKSITAEARDLDRRPFLAEALNAFDLVVFDPPRAGAATQVREIAASRVLRVAAVSCNPATFARDARTLSNAGLRLEKVLPVDQFLWSPQIELVGLFTREKA